MISIFGRFNIRLARRLLIVTCAQSTMIGSFTALNIGILPSSANASAVQLTTLATAPTQLGMMAFDGAGDLFVSNGTNGISVLPPQDTVLFGQHVSADQEVVLSAALGLTDPDGLAFDSNGDLVVANEGGAGQGSVAVISDQSQFYFGQSIPPNIATTVTSTVGKVSNPTGIAFDSGGNLFIANSAGTFSNTITVVPAATGTLFGQTVTKDVALTLLAATGSISAPSGIAFDSAGNLFIANSAGIFANTITVIPKVNEMDFGQQLLANSAVELSNATGLHTPTQIAFDGFGNLFISDVAQSGVQVLPTQNGNLFGQPYQRNLISRLIGTNLPSFLTGLASFNADLYLAGKGGSGFVIASTNKTIFGQLVNQGETRTLFSASTFSSPEGMAVDASGNVYMADPSQNTVYVYPATTGTFFGQQMTAGVMVRLTAAIGLRQPEALTFDSAGNLWIANVGGIESNNMSTGIDVIAPSAPRTIFNQTISIADIPFPAFNYIFATPDPVQIIGDISLAFDSTGTLYISNLGNQRLSVVAPNVTHVFGTTTIVTSLGSIPTPLNAVSNSPLFQNGSDTGAIAFDPAGNLYIADPFNHRIDVLARSTGEIFGQQVTANTVSELQATSGLIGAPTQLAFNSSGDLFIADASEHAIEVLSSQGATIYGQLIAPNVLTTLQASVGLDVPAGIAMDGNRNLYITQGNAFIGWGFAISGSAPASLSVIPSGITVTNVSVALTQTGATPYGGTFLISYVGQHVTFTATVTAHDGPPTTNGYGTLPGDIEFTFNGSDLFGCSAVPLGAASVNGQDLAQSASCVTNLPAGSVGEIKVTYANDPFHNSGSDQLFNYKVEPAVPVSVTSSSNPANLGTPVAFTATVMIGTTTSGLGGASPGTVTFYDAGTALTNCSNLTITSLNTVLFSGTSQCSTQTLSIGLHSVTAKYSGTGNDPPYTSAALGETVVTPQSPPLPMPPSQTTTPKVILTSSTNPAAAGQQVVFIGTVGDSMTSGKMLFFVDGLPNAGCEDVSVTNGEGICETSDLTVGVHVVTATFKDDANTVMSTSNPLTEVVRAQSTTTLSSSANSVIVGGTVNFMASIHGFHPSGTVMFTDSGQVLNSCGAVNLIDATASCSATELSKGVHVIAANYSGDANNVPSTSNVVDEIVVEAKRQPTPVVQVLTKSISQRGTGSRKQQTFGIVIRCKGARCSGTVAVTVARKIHPKQRGVCRKGVPCTHPVVARASKRYDLPSGTSRRIALIETPFGIRNIVEHSVGHLNFRTSLVVTVKDGRTVRSPFLFTKPKNVSR